MEKDYFLITSYTGGPNTELKSKHLIQFLKQIKHYINNSFIIVVDSNYTQNIEKYCDLYLHKLDNFNSTHGEGELSQIKLGIKLLENYNPNFFVKFNYDYWMNDKIFNKYTEWKNLIQSKKIIGSEWQLYNDHPGSSNSFACAFGVYQMESAKKLFEIDKVDFPIEIQLLNKIKSLFKDEDVFIYKDLVSALGDNCIDFFGDAGKGCHFDLLNKTHNDII